MVCGVYKDQTRRTASDKLLRNEGFEISSNLNMMKIKEDSLNS